jgi:hypothetical protein
LKTRSTLLLFLLAATLASSPCLLAPAAHAQTVTNLHDYDFPADGSGGSLPFGNLIQATDGNIYGTILGGGPSYNDGIGGTGGIFKITPAGVYSILYACNDAGSDCNGPVSLVQLQDGNLYVVSSEGGAYGYGNLFTVSLAGLFTDLHDFSNDANGAYPNDNMTVGTSGSSIILWGVNSGSESAGDLAPWGNIWSYKPNLGNGSPVFSNYYTFLQNTYGFDPISGVAQIGGKLYTTTQFGGSDGCGTLIKLANGTPTLLHMFTCGADGAYPQGEPKLYTDGFLYGITVENGSGPDYGSIWKAGLSTGFTTLYTFTGSRHNPNSTVTFDNSGNMLFTAGKGGSNSVGGLYLESRGGGAVDDLFDYSANSVEGEGPYAQPFIDNAGHLWTESFSGGSGESLGAIDTWSLSSETSAPIHISISPSTASPNAKAVVSWYTTNSWSDGEQYCFGSGNSDTGWTGKQQTGQATSNEYAGTYTTSFANSGTYTFGITCGGTETAIATLQIGSVSSVAITASANPISEGQSETLGVTVSGNSGYPTGKVALSVAGTAIGSVTLANGTGKLVASTAGIGPGTYPITATYPGDSTYTPSTKTINITVESGGPSATTTTVSAPASLAPSQAFTITATVKKTSGSGAPTGTVTFKQGSTTLGTGTLNGSGVATLNTAAPSTIGSYNITANYGGDTNDTASSGTATINVGGPSTTTLSISPTTVKSGASTTVTITVKGGGATPTGSVSLLDGTTVLATVPLSAGTASFSASTAGYPTGPYVLHATYAGNATYAPSTSGNVTVTID